MDVQESLGLSLDEMVSVVTSELHEDPYTLDEVWASREINSNNVEIPY